MASAKPSRPDSSPAADAGTKDRLLDCAEELFAGEGFDAVSLRHITQAAGVNLAAVNYHFGSKDGLIQAIIERRVNPINEQRLVNLREARAEFGPEKPIPIRILVEAFIRPTLTTIKESTLSERLFSKLMGRCLSDSGPYFPVSIMPLAKQVARRYAGEIQRTLPHLREEVILWRLHFSFGALVHTLFHPEILDVITEGRAGKPALEETLGRIVDYCSQGFEAPDSPNRESA